jgi:hypothetical protein
MVDFSTLSTRDVSDIALQRTETLLRAPRLGPISYMLWTTGMNWPLRTESILRRRSILRGAWGAALSEWPDIAPFLPRGGGAEICDIGCGHAFIDLVAAQHHSQANITLIDIEQTNARHHGFAANGAGYASLNSARRFLTTNGVSAERIQTCNPKMNDLPTGPFDLMISLLSAGFHYPVSEYVDFALRTLKSGGAFIFDMRRGSGQQAAVGSFSDIRILRASQKGERLAAIK